GLARRRVAVRWGAVLMMSESESPHPRGIYWRGVHLHDATKDSAVGEHVEVVVVPLAGGARGRGAFEDQIVLVHFYQVSGDFGCCARPASDCRAAEQRDELAAF